MKKKHRSDRRSIGLSQYEGSIEPLVLPSPSLSLAPPFFHRSSSPFIFRAHSRFKLLHIRPEFNQQLEMTAGADGRARSIVLVCEAGARRGNETQEVGRWRGERAGTTGDGQGGAANRDSAEGEEGDRSRPMRAGVKKSEASRASKVVDGGRLPGLPFRQQSWSLKLNNDSLLHADAHFPPMQRATGSGLKYLRRFCGAAEF